MSLRRIRGILAIKYHFGEAYPPVLDRDEMPRTAVYEMAYRIIP